MLSLPDISKAQISGTVWSQSNLLTASSSKLGSGGRSVTRSAGTVGMVSDQCTRRRLVAYVVGRTWVADAARVRSLTRAQGPREGKREEDEKSC